ncbi:MAG: aminoglycoside phosphotransferase family protein [Cohnella sp.]|nr:aminoglycoside phosphotransferase family protein [Cohnella sp.]
MKDHWERPAAPVSLDLRKIETLVKPVFGGKRVLAAKRIGTGFSNSNYKIQLDGIDEPYLLRLYRQDEEIADKELAISRLVGETIPVPDFIYADWSRTKYERPWAVLQWKEGSLLKEVLKTGTNEDLASAGGSVGSILAKIHSFTFPVGGFFDQNLDIKEPIQMGSDGFLGFMEQSLFVQSSGKWLGEDLTQALWSFCQKYGPLLSEVKDSPVLVHSDFNGLNILVEQEAPGHPISAVLDWEFAFAGSRYVDIANMLRYEENDSIFERHFIRSYQEQGDKLAHNWKLLSRLEDLIALCDMLNHSTTKTPNRIHDLQRLIQKTVLSQPNT